MRFLFGEEHDAAWAGYGALERCFFYGSLSDAVDKLVGHALLGDDLPLSGRALFVSGRVSFEIVQKAAMAGVPLVAAVSAPSSLANGAAFNDTASVGASNPDPNTANNTATVTGSVVNNNPNADLAVSVSGR